VSAPIRRAPWALIVLAAVLAAVTWTTGGPPDDIGAEQLADAIEHAKRDAEERRLQQALREGR
jgi:hypothetical protein